MKNANNSPSEKKETSLIKKMFILVVGLYLIGGMQVIAQAVERDPVTISVVVVNPSDEKPQKFPVKIDLPQEVKPDGVIQQDGLTLEYDDQRSSYYLYNREVELEPKETRVFKVIVEDVWFVPEKEVKTLKKHTDRILNKLKNSEYFASAKKLGDSIYSRLTKIETEQADESIGQKRRIGNFRYHTEMIKKIRADIEEMEKLLQFAGGVPVPEMLEASKLKSDAPSTKTTWLIIFIILAFIGFVAVQFFFTWNSRAKAEKEFDEKRRQSLPGSMPDRDSASKAA